MFEMTATRDAAPDGMNVKRFFAGVVYRKSELSEEIYNAYKKRGDLTEIKESFVPEKSEASENNHIATVEEKQKRGRKKRGEN